MVLYEKYTQMVGIVKDAKGREMMACCQSIESKTCSAGFRR
jgi:hypothetical protein